MASSTALFKDDNNTPLKYPAGLRPGFSAGGILTVTSTASTIEYAVGVVPGTVHGNFLMRILSATQPVFYAFGQTGQSANFTGVTNMIYLPAGVTEFARFDVNDKSVYILQSGAGSVVQMSFMVS